jgi:predicted phosphodiesterase
MGPTLTRRPSPLRRVAVLCDIHGNLPALEAVLDDVRQAGPDVIVVGGDLLPGPMPRETLARLLTLDRPVHFVHGNGDLAVLAQMEAARTGVVRYWGTTSGAPLPEPHLAATRWTAQQLEPHDEPVLSGWPKTLRLQVDGLGPVLFCHATPRSEVEIFTRLTPAEALLPVFGGLDVAVVVCGHTHMPFDRTIGATRVVNAGSVGAPYGEPGAYWLLLGRDIRLQHTRFDLERAAQRIRQTRYPGASEFAARVLRPHAESEALEVFEKAALR